MKQLSNCLLFVLIVIVISCTPKDDALETSPYTPVDHPPEYIDSMVDIYLTHGAWQQDLYSGKWQAEIDKGLAVDSTIAYFWQQKAMPMYKMGKYEIGESYLDHAVKYKPNEYLEYRAFMTCIFTKRYKQAIEDFEACKRLYGNSYVMDHTYDFYIALSKLMLEEYEEAEALLDAEVNNQMIENGGTGINYLDAFYHGISQYEQEKHKDAILSFDKSLSTYPAFADALYYKAMSAGAIGDTIEANLSFQKAVKYGKLGNSINEDNSIYEHYPYQKRWHFFK